MGVIGNIKVLVGQDEEFKKKVSSSNPPPKKILIVEDEKKLANILEDSLKDAGFDVIKAENGEIGLELIKTHHPDLVLLDLMMPIMDGKVMLRKLRGIPQFKKLPVIILTNAGEVENIKETQMYYDAEHFLIKSNVSTEEIVKKVKGYFGHA
jgi:two-component system response regulator/two-component system chemotaxis response regulator CheY